MSLNLEEYVATIRDFPTEGILFRDITPIFENGEAFSECIGRMADFAASVNADLIVGPESRGFLVGAPAALMLKIGFVPVRKPGKLPRETISCKYDLEYGSNELFMHKDSVKPGQRVVIMDDLLATGGTVEATIKMVEQLGGIVAGLAFIIELDGLDGIKKLEGYNVYRVMHLSDK